MENTFLQEVVEKTVMECVWLMEKMLSAMPTSEIDKIQVIGVNSHDALLLSNYGTIISVCYPNDKGYEDIYFMGGLRLFRIKIIES